MTAALPSPAAADPARAGTVLALHSSGSQLGVGMRWLDCSQPDRIRSFDRGRALANALLTCVEEVCPASEWSTLARLAVATGPGGFTSTRLTVVLARTLAQQLAVPLDGVGSLALVARRMGLHGPSWLVQELPRRGLVAGLYGPDPDRSGAMREWLSPRLHADGSALQALRPAPCLPVVENVQADTLALLDLASAAHAQAVAAPWQPVLPIYPTSPVALA
jgi:tRNA threonylcarbamoyl adenosine modification protein YeaZ